MKKIVWAPTALKDLREIYDFIYHENFLEAQKLCERLILKTEQLAQFPEMGRKIPEIGESRYRELIVEGYRIFHEVRPDRLIVFRVWHSRRQFEIHKY